MLDYFTPMDQACRLLPNDLDLGAGGPLIFPTQGGTYPDEVIEAGKGGSPCDLFGSTYAVPIDLLNRDSMGVTIPIRTRTFRRSKARSTDTGVTQHIGRAEPHNMFITRE